MNRFSKLMNNSKLDNEQVLPPDESLDQFNKFSQVNKQNIGPNLNLDVPETFKGAYEGTQNLRQKAIEKIAEQTDIGKDIPGVGANEDYRNVAKTGLDMVLPDVSDVIPAGKLGHTANAMFPMLGMLGKEAKILKFPTKTTQTAEEMIQGLRKLDSHDLSLGSNLLNKPVLKTAEEKAAEQLPNAFGKVIGGGPSAQNVMDMAKNDPIYATRLAELLADKKNIPPTAYDNKKQAIFNEIRKKLGGM